MGEAASGSNCILTFIASNMLIFKIDGFQISYSQVTHLQNLQPTSDLWVIVISCICSQYKLMSLFPPPSSYNNAGANRKMIRSSSYTARNCFFSPVQCHLSKTPLGGGDSSLRRRRRILTGTATAPSYDDYAPIARFRRDYIDYAY